MRSIFLPAICAVVLLLMSVSVIAVSDAEDNDDWHPAFDTLSNMEQKAYSTMEDCVRNMYDSADISELTIDQGYKVIQALASDHPEYFWLDHYGLYGYSETYMCSSIELIDEIDDSEIYVKKLAIDAAIASIDITGDTAVERLKSINDWLNVHILYDNTTENSGNIYGAFVENRAKCDGYVYAANYLCKLYGLDSICLIGTLADGERHAWNAMRADDEKWYQTDITWNDPMCPGVAGSEYFMIGSETVRDTGKFSEGRVTDYDFGLDLQKEQYNYVSPESEYGTLWAALDYDTVSRYSEYHSTTSFTVNGLEIEMSEETLDKVKKSMEQSSTSIWYILVTNSKTVQDLDGISPMDYSIAMYLDESPLSPSEYGSWGLIVIAPAYEGKGIFHACYYTREGSLISEDEMQLVGDPAFSVSYVEEENPSSDGQFVWVIIVIVSVIVLLLAYVVIRRRRL